MRKPTTKQSQSHLQRALFACANRQRRNITYDTTPSDAGQLQKSHRKTANVRQTISFSSFSIFKTSDSIDFPDKLWTRRGREWKVKGNAPYIFDARARTQRERETNVEWFVLFFFSLQTIDKIGFRLEIAETSNRLSNTGTPIRQRLWKLI